MKFKRENNSILAVSEGERTERALFSKSVESHLLFEILQELQKLNKKVSTKK